MTLLTVLFAAAAAFPMAQDRARIAEIAAALPEKPGWTVPVPDGDPAKVRQLLAAPIPDCPDELYLLFTKTGNRDKYQGPYFERIANLRNLACSAYRTHDRKVLDLVVKYLEAICAERAWTMPAHDGKLENFNGKAVTIDLGATHRVDCLSFTLWALGDLLPAETVRKVRAEMERRVFEPYRRTARDCADGETFHGNWWFFGESNWNAVCHSGVVRAALGVIESREDRAVFVEGAERGMRFFLAGFCDDGYCTEGGDYWTYGYGNFLDLAQAVRKTTGGKVDFSKLPRAKKPMEYGFGFRLYGGRCPDYADGGPKAPARRYLELGAELWPEYAKYLDGTLPARNYYPFAQVYIGRSKSFAFAIKGGNNDELHNHNDLGSWDMAVNGVDIAGDPGDEVYTARTFSPQRYVSKVLNSYGHPVPVVGGQLQGKGAKFAARVLETSFSAKRDVIEYDLAGGYPVPPDILRRRVVFDRAADAVEIRDTVRFAAPAAFESAISTYSEVAKEGNGRTLVLTGRNGKRTESVRLSVAVTGGDWTWTEETYENPGRRSPRRLAVSFKAPVESAEIVWRFSRIDPAARNLTVGMLPGEHWWGLCNNFGTQMPFTSATDLKLDLRRDNYAHQSASVLVSDKGRAVWCAEPVGVEIANGTIRLASDKGEIVLVEKAGRNLAEAYRYASAHWFPPTGEDPDLLYFSAPQYNTWIELTYHQNEKDILAYAKSMIDHGLPPGVFMIDDTWQREYGAWEFEPTRFGDPKGMVEKLHAMGYKVLLWMCPFVSMDTPEFRRVQWGANPDDVKGYPTRGGFLTTPDEGEQWKTPAAVPVKWWNGTSALLDFTHPNAVAWFDEQLERLCRDYGADGFKFDGGSVSFYTGSRVYGGVVRANDPSVSAAAQSALYGRFALKYRGSEYRNGFGFGGKPVIMRLHDKDHSWAALGRLIPDMLAAGFVGCPFICPDMVGGGSWTAFLPGAPFSQELFIRSAQVQALCPMMQISASPWRYLDAEHQKVFSETVRLRQRFAPQFVALAKKAAKDGEPMMRNLEYAFPGRGYAAIGDEFMMGTDLLVAPQIAEGARTREVEIPPGTWQADDGTTVEGPKRITVETPLARLPHFVRR